MKVLSLKLKEDIFTAAERIVHAMHLPRNTYINQAVALYNELCQRKLLRRQLRRESQLVQPSTLEVLKEFERLNDQLPG